MTYYSYNFTGSIIPASKEGVVGLGFIPAAGVNWSEFAQVTIDGFTGTFVVIDITEPGGTNDAYRGGIQSVDKSFSGQGISVPLPFELPLAAADIGFVDSATITIAGVWFDGLNGRDKVLEDLRTEKKYVHETYQTAPYVFLLSNRAYFVWLTGYSANIVGGQGNIISVRLGLSICSGKGQYGT
jgi:hypothetical protein